MIAEAFAAVVAATVEACHQRYAERLQGVVIFGSVGRERMRPDSDIDLLVVAEPLPRGRLARMDEFDVVEAHIAPVLAVVKRQGVDTYLSPLVRTLAELDQGAFLIFDIACDGRVVYDRHGAVTAYLASVRERLEQRGAKRFSASGARYWALEPNVGPNDVVVL